PLPLRAGRSLATPGAEAARTGASRRRRRAPRVQASADQLRRGVARAAPAAPPADPRHRRLGARLLLSGRRLGADRPTAQRLQSERPAVDLARRATRLPRGRADRGLALSRRALRRRARAPRARYRRLGAGALRPRRRTPAPRRGR